MPAVLKPWGHELIWAHTDRYVGKILHIRAGEALSMPFAGVHIVEATKQVYRALPAHRERVRLIPSLQPVLLPSPSARGRTEL